MDVTDPLSPQAAAEATRCVDQYRKDLLAEAARLEAAMHSAGTHELTPTHVHDANRALRHPYFRSKSVGGLDVFLQLLIVGGGAALGIGTNNIDKLWGQVLFVSSLVVCATAIVVNLIRSRA
jgi:hypothetical protein